MQQFRQRRQPKMRTASSCTLLVALVAALQLSSLAAAAQGGNANSRRLLQPFNLGLGRADRTKANAGYAREQQLINIANGGVFANVDTSPDVDASINAGATQVALGTNLNFGGVTKSTRQSEAATNLDNAKTQTSTDARSIAKPGPGLTAHSILDSSTSLSQRRITPAGPPGDPGADRPPGVGPNDNRPLGSWEVLSATATDYGWVGDYDYSLYDALKNTATYVASAQEYDYDYGQPRIIPETAQISTRTKTDLSDTPGRAAAFTRVKGAATAPNAVSRQFSRSAGISGVTAARQNDDLFGTTPVFIPTNPFRTQGSAAAGAARATTWKPALFPGSTANSGNAGQVISRTYQPAGGASDQLTAVAGTKSSQARSETVALGNVENLDFADVGRRH